MNRITETELRQALAVSARRLFYLLKLWGAVAIAYVIARVVH